MTGKMTHDELLEHLMQAWRDLAEAKGRLRALLEDTQHREHECGDADCPVAAARALLLK